MMTSSTCSGAMPARSTAARIAMAPRSEPGMSRNAPPRRPIGVRAPLTITTSVAMAASLPYSCRHTLGYLAQCLDLAHRLRLAGSAHPHSRTTRAWKKARLPRSVPTASKVAE